MKLQICELPGAASVVLVSIVLLGCDRPTAVSSSSLKASVTEDVARQIDSRGHFVLPVSADGDEQEISAERAKELAAAMWHDGAGFIRNTIERDRGQAVHVDRLQPCERAYYVTSAYVSLPKDVPTAIRKALGPQWLVGLCNDGVQEVVVSVSAYATDADVKPGSVRLDPGVGNFFTMGVPIGVELPTPPEEIAEFVAQSTKRRVSSVPRLIRRPFPNAAVVAVWQVALESPAPVKGRSGKTRNTTALFAGHVNGWSRSALAGPLDGIVEESRDLLEFIAPGGVRVAHFEVTRKPGIPRSMELVALEGR